MKAVITLAVTLPKKEIQRLGRWFRENVNPRVVLEVRLDPNLVGGCQIIWQGFEGDFSLRKKLKHNG